MFRILLFHQTSSSCAEVALTFFLIDFSIEIGAALISFLSLPRRVVANRKVHFLTVFGYIILYLPSFLFFLSIYILRALCIGIIDYQRLSVMLSFSKSYHNDPILVCRQS